MPKATFIESALYCRIKINDRHTPSEQGLIGSFDASWF